MTSQNHRDNGSLPLAENFNDLMQNLNTLKEQGEGNAFIEILVFLAHYGILSQKEMPKLLDYSRRTIITNLKKLENQRLISYVYKRNSNTYGRPQNKWTISFGGMLSLFVSFWKIDFQNIRLNKLKTNLADIIADKFKLEWIIFREWGYIKQDPLIRMHVENVILDYVYKNLLYLDAFSDVPSYSSEAYDTVWRDQGSKKRDYLHKKLDEEMKKELIREIIGIKSIFESHLKDKVFYIMENVMPYLMKNPNLRPLYEKELDFLEEKYELIKNIEVLLENPENAKELSDDYFYASLNIEEKYW